MNQANKMGISVTDRTSKECFVPDSLELHLYGIESVDRLNTIWVGLTRLLLLANIFVDIPSSER
jgi:hypothetical protein